VLIPFVNFELFDPVSDRIKMQWGFFHYHASFKGLFYPPGSILYKFLTSLRIPIAASEGESWINLGLVGSALLFTMMFVSILRLLTKNRTNRESLFTTENKIMLAGASLMLIYAANYALYGFAKNWMENHLGPLLMFKASGRMAWSFYFAITITGVVFLDKYLKKIKTQWLSYILLFVLCTIWFFDIRQYVGSKVKDAFHPNFFNSSSRQEMLNILDENKIDISQYQAILALPKMVSWSDNFVSNINWSAQFHSMRISAATGLPMISAMLSRISTSHAAESIQMLAHPIIERDILPKLPNQKDLLLLVGVEYPPLTIGEQYLIDISTPLYKSNSFSLYRLSIDSLQQKRYMDEARFIYSQKLPLQKDAIHISFDEENSSDSFYGKGSKLIHEGTTTLIDQALSITADTHFVFSAWSKIEYDRHGLGVWEITVSDSLGNVVFNERIDARKSADIQDMWMRSEIIFPVREGFRLKVSIESNKDLYIDEILIYPVFSNNIIDMAEDDSFLLNGYKVHKQ
ncbi:MAG TPA: hypothetical protein VMZ69_00630, partial [Saprospiraceae bacterium]|nr:hypothetical protein [Saprospiraceae bacterium]